MADFEEPAAVPLAQKPAPRRSGRAWYVLGGIVLALALTLGGVLMTAPALAAGPGGSGGVNVRQYPTRTPGMPGQCGGQLTVTKVTDGTITVTGPNGNTSTVYVNSHTQYEKNGQAVAAGAVVAGSHIYVVGACANQGHTIRATRIEIVG